MKSSENKNVENKISNENSEFSPSTFSGDSFEKAMNHIRNVIENNEKYKDYHCKSYRTLLFTKTSIELAFEYLIDSVKFDENSPVYKDENFKNYLKGIHMGMLLTYVDIDFNQIPKNTIEQVKLCTDKKVNLGENQYEIVKLINWRSKEQWEYFANAFEIESDLGKLCLQKSKSA